MGLIAATATAWGFAEATLFFIVPEVWLTWVVLRHGWSKALVASLFATSGALVGGAIMYYWGAVDVQAARQTLDLVPAITPAMIGSASAELRAGVLSAVLSGALQGVPYKVFAVEAGAARIDALGFAGATLVARLLRFWAVMAFLWLLAAVLRRWLNEQSVAALFAIGWLSFYGLFFSIMPG